MYRFLIINTYYPEVIRKVYQDYPNLDKKTYAEQIEALFAAGFARSNFLQKHLQVLGYEAKNIIMNATKLQETWAKECNFVPQATFIPEDWYRTLGLGINKVTRTHFVGSISNRLQQIAMAQIKTFKPDIVLMENLTAFSPYHLDTIKQYCRVLIGECNYPIPKIDLRHYDLMLSAHPAIADGFKKMGTPALYWPHAFEDSVLNKIVDIEKSTTTPFIFAGSVIGSRFFLYHERWRMISALHKQVPIEVWGKFHEPPINLKVHHSVWGYEMHRVLAAASISLNVHTDKYANYTTHETYTGYATNMRLFETTGVGTCLLTDWKPNLSQLFNLDTEIVSYRSIDECVEKAKWLLDNPIEAARIAKAGQARCLHDHTLKQRSELLDNATRNLLHKNRSKTTK